MDSRPDNRDATPVPVAGAPNMVEDFRARVNDLAADAQGAGLHAAGIIAALRSVADAWESAEPES